MTVPPAPVLDAGAEQQMRADLCDAMRALEATLRPSPTYMLDVQRDVNAAFREILVDWLVEVTAKFRCVPETLFLAVAYIDRFLAVKEIRRTQLQLLGVSSLLLATKYEQVRSLSVRDLVMVSAKTYTDKEVIDMETSIAQTLDFRLSGATCSHFLNVFAVAAQSCEREKHHASYLAELALSKYESLQFTASVLAAAALLCARLMLKHSPLWADAVTACAHVDAADLGPCAEFLMGLHRAAPSARLKAVHKKYAGAKLSEASSVAPLSSEDIDAATAWQGAGTRYGGDENPEPCAERPKATIAPPHASSVSFAIDVEPVPRGRRPAWLKSSLCSSCIAGAKATFVFKVREDAVRAQYYFCLERDLVATDVREINN